MFGSFNCLRLSAFEIENFECCDGSTLEYKMHNRPTAKCKFIVTNETALATPCSMAWFPYSDENMYTLTQLTVDHEFASGSPSSTDSNKDKMVFSCNRNLQIEQKNFLNLWIVGRNTRWLITFKPNSIVDAWMRAHGARVWVLQTQQAQTGQLKIWMKSSFTAHESCVCASFWPYLWNGNLSFVPGQGKSEKFVRCVIE